MQFAAKRALDLAGAGVLLILAAPVLALCVLAIRLDSRGPALFTQRRVGRHGRPFRLLKLRTMVCGAEAEAEALMAASAEPGWLKLADDPRITRIGRVLRRTSLDELPQLLNVLRGDMSLVGPRPLPESVGVPAWARRRHDMPPGLTGLWQVSGRDETSFEEMLQLDRDYVDSWSHRTDLRLLARTPAAVLRGRGAG